MTIEELEKKLTELDDLRTELNTQIAALKAQREEPKPPHRRWKPEYREEYYSVIGNGCVIDTYWAVCESDMGEYAIGNVFKTEAEAKFAAERLKVLAEMREWAGAWKDKYLLCYYSETDTVAVDCISPSYNTFGEMRFATREDAEKCIAVVGADRIKRYYFMILKEENKECR